MLRIPSSVLARADPVIGWLGRRARDRAAFGQPGFARRRIRRSAV